MMTETRLQAIEESLSPLAFDKRELLAEVKRLRTVLLEISEHELHEDAGQAKDDGHAMKLIASAALHGKDDEPANTATEEDRIQSTLRDQFAAHAMQALIIADPLDKSESHTAEQAYHYAQAMMVERQRQYKAV